MKELNLKPRKRPEDITVLGVKKKSGIFKKGQTDLDRFLKSN